MGIFFINMFWKMFCGHSEKHLRQKTACGHLVGQRCLKLSLLCTKRCCTILIQFFFKLETQIWRRRLEFQCRWWRWFCSRSKDHQNNQTPEVRWRSCLLWYCCSDNWANWIYWICQASLLAQLKGFHGGQIWWSK